MKGRPKGIHVWSEGKYVGNIIYTYRVPLMSEEELEEASEVFALPDGTYLIVEG